MIINDKDLVDILREEYGAYIISCDSYYFEVESSDRLPIELAQLSVRYSVDTSYASINVLGQNQVVDHVSSSLQYSRYTFLTSAQEQFEAVLAQELEKRRYKEFSKTFDAEVQSELKQ